MTFKGWMVQVDGILEAKLGLTSRDLPDLDYYDMFEDGMTPLAAAYKALRENGF